MMLFLQDNFSAGMDAEFHSSKLLEGCYPLLINGRVRRNVVTPTKKHVEILSPVGEKQGLYAVGSYLVLFAAGEAFYKDLSVLGQWIPIPDWTPLNTTGLIYAEPVPATNNQFNQTGGDPKSVIPIFNGSIGRTSAALLVTDGVHQSRLIFPDSSWRDTLTYAEWTKDTPEYVPICTMPCMSGNKLYAIEGTNIFNSVTGRPTDFVVNITSEGDKGGDAYSTAKTVDYNTITAVASLSDGGLFVSTLYASYALTPDYDNTLFAEPMLRDQLLFPTGALNKFSIVDILGDTAFITQSGIHSFNLTAQTMRESNNYPLGAKVSSYFENPQTNTAAINFDDYALFAMNTIYGPGVFAYDTVRKVFTSLDIDFGEVKQFAVAKLDGARRLFFITTSDRVFEAYAGEEYSTCRIYLGDFNTHVPGKQHKAQTVKLVFGNVSADFTAQMSYYADRKLIETRSRSLTSEIGASVNPLSLPFEDLKKVAPVSFALSNTSGSCWKSGVYVEWSGGAELCSMELDGQVDELDSFVRMTTDDVPPQVVTVFADNRAELIASAGDLRTVDVVVGDKYYVAGIASSVQGRFNNEVFTAAADRIRLTGSLYNVTTMHSVYSLMRRRMPDLYVGAGNHVHEGAIGYDKFMEIWERSDIDKSILVPGKYDLDNTGGKYLYQIIPSVRYYKYSIDNADFFALTSGYNSLGTQVCPDGNDSASAQALWLKTALRESTAGFKIVVLGAPPYSDTAISGSATLRWPFGEWGANLVIAGGSCAYQRFILEGLTFINVPPCGETPEEFVADTKVTGYAASGFVKLSIDRYNLRGQMVKLDGSVLDNFAVYA